MHPEPKRLLTYALLPTSLNQFVEFWAARYYDRNESLYTDNINKNHTEETLTALFKWKLGIHASAPKIRSALKENFLSRIEEARTLPADICAEDFLQNCFPNGGPISRIFWLHCWFPHRFPIYDQNVHRAMSFIGAGRQEELDEGRVIGQYLTYYIPFFEPFRNASRNLAFTQADDGIRERKADRALFVFGIEVKSKFTEMAAVVSAVTA